MIASSFRSDLVSLRMMYDLLVQVLWYPGGKGHGQIDDSGRVQRRETS
jgi:hypothetical protein